MKLRWGEVAAIFMRILRLGVRTVIFQKVHKGRAPELMALLRLLGRRVIYVECDERERLEFVRHVDLLVAPSAELADDLTSRTGIRTAYIPDPLEYWAPEALSFPWQPKRRYRTLWIGSHKNWHQIADLKVSIAGRGITAFEIITISDHPDADIPWSLETVREELSRADLGIIPVTADSCSAKKSHNRATLFMAVGIPVIVNDTPVYREVIADGETGFVYHSLDDLAALPDRLSNTELVDAVRTAAMARSEAFSLAKAAALWRALVEDD